MNRPSAAQSWVLALWSVYIATWAVASGSNPTIVGAWWLVGVVLLRATMGRGLRVGARPPDPSETGAHDASTARGLHLGDALEDWESEGGAIA